MRQTSVGKAVAPGVSKASEMRVDRDCVSVKMRMCHYCGYMPSKALIPFDGARCPKCFCSCWERLVVPCHLFHFFVSD